jgi:methionyl-tRNA formyltransferase
VACGKGLLSIEELQLAGKKRMKTIEFLRGFQFKVNSKFI